MTHKIIPSAVKILQAGGLVAIPTETVYGLACDAQNPKALDALYTVKGRPSNHPVIVHIASIHALPQWAIDIPENAYRLAQAFWPGPLTLILKKHPAVLDAVTGGQQTIGLRVPNHPLTLQLLQTFKEGKGGLAAPSANKFGRISPTKASHVQDDLGTEVDLILDGGPCPVGVESTIADLSQGTPTILRPGMVSETAILECLNLDSPTLVATQGKQTLSLLSPRVPGALTSHYAPIATTHLLPTTALLAYLQAHPSERLGILAFDKTLSEPSVETLGSEENVHWQAIAMPTDANLYASKLYSALRTLDAKQPESILIEAVPNTLEWLAVSDRLNRASTLPGII